MKNAFKIDTTPMDASMFTDTEFDSAAKKADFGLQFLKFVASDFAQAGFTNKFYNRLNGTFGHIFHYNRDGFFQTHFSNTSSKINFLKMTMTYPCYGQPIFTFCDVEAEIQKRLLQSGVFRELNIRLNQEVEMRERAVLASLTRKYGNNDPVISTP